MATIQDSQYNVTRRTIHIPKPYAAVEAKLQSSISAQPGHALSTLLGSQSRDEFDAHTDSFLGPHGFMQFVTLDHGKWIGYYDVHKGKALTRIIFGNPKIAITMIEHDVTAGLFAPVEALLVDLGDDKGTDIVYMVPSSLIAGGDPSNTALREAAVKLDQKLDSLWQFVASD